SVWPRAPGPASRRAPRHEGAGAGRPRRASGGARNGYGELSREGEGRRLRSSRRAPRANRASAASGGRGPPCRRHRQVRPRRRSRAPNPLARLAAAAAALFFLIVAVASIGDVVLLSQQASGQCARAPAPGGGSLHGVPKTYIPLFVGASRRYGLDPR